MIKGHAKSKKQKAIESNTSMITSCSVKKKRVYQKASKQPELLAAAPVSLTTYRLITSSQVSAKYKTSQFRRASKSSDNLAISEHI